MAKIKVTLVKSTIGCLKNQQETVRSLGLKKTNSFVIKEDTPEIRAMIFTVKHLVKVEDVQE